MPLSKYYGFGCGQRRQKAARTRLPRLQVYSSSFHQEIFLKCRYHIFHLHTSLPSFAF